MPIADGTAPQGLQHYQQHRSSSVIEMNRLFPVQTGRVSYTFKVRMDTDQTAPNYFATNADFYVVSGMTSSSGSGTLAIHFIFRPEGKIRVRGSQGTLGTDPYVGEWDGTGSLPSARGGMAHHHRGRRHCDEHVQAVLRRD